MLSPLLHTLYTHDCTPIHHSNNFLKSADDTTVVGDISRGDESNYRDEVEQSVEWCRVNPLSAKVANLRHNTVLNKTAVFS